MRGDLAAGALAHGRGQTGVVLVVVGQHQQLDVLDAPAVRRERRLERVDAGAPARAGVDQRQRVAGQQVRVDVADRIGDARRSAIGSDGDDDRPPEHGLPSTRAVDLDRRPGRALARPRTPAAALHTVAGEDVAQEAHRARRSAPTPPAQRVTMFSRYDMFDGPWLTWPVAESRAPARSSASMWIGFGSRSSAAISFIFSGSTDSITSGGSSLPDRDAAVLMRSSSRRGKTKLVVLTATGSVRARLGARAARRSRCRRRRRGGPPCARRRRCRPDLVLALDLERRRELEALLADHDARTRSCLEQVEDVLEVTPDPWTAA